MSPPQHGTPPAGEMLVPRRGLKAPCACADHETQQRERWVCSGYSQRGKGRAQKSLPRLCSVRNSQVPPPPRSTESCASSDIGNGNFLSHGSEGTGILLSAKAQGRKKKKKKQAQTKKHRSQHFKRG